MHAPTRTSYSTHNEDTHAWAAPPPSVYATTNGSLFLDCQVISIHGKLLVNGMDVVDILEQFDAFVLAVSSAAGLLSPAPIVGVNMGGRELACPLPTPAGIYPQNGRNLVLQAPCRVQLGGDLVVNGVSWLASAAAACESARALLALATAALGSTPALKPLFCTPEQTADNHQVVERGAVFVGADGADLLLLPRRDLKNKNGTVHTSAIQVLVGRVELMSTWPTLNATMAALYAAFQSLDTAPLTETKVLTVAAGSTDWRTLWGIGLAFAGALPRLAYVRQAEQALMLLSCLTPACSPNVTEMLAPGPVSGVGLAVRADGLPVLSFIAKCGVACYELKVAKCSSTTCAAGTVSIATVNGANVNPRNSTVIALRSDTGSPVVLYSDNRGFVVLVACDDDTCSAPVTIDTETPCVGPIALALHPITHLPTIGFCERGALCTSPTCAQASDPYIRPASTVKVQVPASYSDTERPLFAVVTAGNAVQLQYCHSGCNSVDNHVTLDVSATAKFYVNLKRHPVSGVPVAAYATGAAQIPDSVFVAVCRDARCGGVTLTRVATAGSPGWHLALALQPITNNPALAFYDITTGHLFLVLCATQTCAQPI